MEEASREATPAATGRPSAESSSGLVHWNNTFRATYLPRHPEHHCANDPEATMISDNDLYRLAIFLGSAAMVLIIFYHFVEVNKEEELPAKAVGTAKPAKAVS
ncbi:hypothetical protein CTA2_9620 [Colletotrichum tanaceti]|nr:hypothetical protein CTA2_9620 [Colletotrichum tanaceti]